MAIFVDDAVDTPDIKDGVEVGDVIHFVVCQNDVEYGIIETVTWAASNVNNNVLIDLNTCTYFYKDQDGDGYGDPDDRICTDANSAEYPVSVGGDCNDDDFDTKPGATEICDGEDNDCDSVIPTNETDDDSDGMSECEGDCNDADPNIYLGAPELCDGIDNDCTDGVPVTEIDNDGDGMSECQGDCDDADPNTYLGAPELCDGKDNDCTDGIPLTEIDNDSDGMSECQGDCDDADPNTLPGATEVCDGKDNDCDSVIPTNETDDDSDGMSECEGDCNDADPNIYLGAPELCDGIDNDCTDGVPVTEIDNDGDGMWECEGDCDDADPNTYLGAPELCDGKDNDCTDGVPVNEADEDEDGVRICENDCDDTDDTVNPNVAYDLYNGVDNDCDTLVDEDCYFDANVTAIGQDSTDAAVTLGLASADDYTLAVTMNCSSGETVCVQLIAANAVTQGLDPNDYYLLEDIRAAAGDIQLAWYAEVDLGASANPNAQLYYPQLQWNPNDLGCNTGFGEFYTYALLRGHGNNGAVLVPDMLTADFYDTQEADNVAAEGETPVLNYTILFTTLTAPPAPAVNGPSSTKNRRPTWTWTSGGGSGVGVYRIKLDSNDLTGQAETTATSYTPSGNLSVGNHTLYVQERNSAGIWSASGSKLVRIVREGATLSGIVGTPGLFSSFLSVPRYPITPSSPGFGVPMIPRFAPYPTITSLPYQYLRYTQPSIFSVPQYPFVPGVRGYPGIPGPPVFKLVFPSLPSQLIYPY